MDPSQHRMLATSNKRIGAGSKNNAGAAMPKLKDSCDTCAASKIRCDKQKPLCGRCERLGYPCFYSPARRTGYARSRGVNQNEAAASRGPSHAPHINSSGVSGEWMSIAAQQKSKSSTANPPVPDGKSKSPTSIQDHALDGPRNNDSDSQNGITTSRPQGSTITGEYFANRTVAEGLAQGSDCAIASVNTVIQLQLAMAKLQLQQEHARSRHRNEGCAPPLQIGQNFGLRDAMTTVTNAFGILSTILVCPCFGSPEIGLLTTAVFLSIFDVYRTILVISESDVSDSVQSTPDSDADLACILASVEDEFGHGHMSPFESSYNSSINSVNSSSSLSDAGTESLVADRVPEELAKVARIILQFAKRYRGGGSGRQAPEFLKNLDHLLRSQLQSVTMEATTRRV
ncbi:hypothetical protein LTR84_008137 [Exophiala bonariae]|uniref:Zn(2)-C6 fungal-type domain-containing protein n=1 Tax=Exophiala bonariae TaxID=1690606 RepID=A0AAV9NM17_9EURO|nr:hypothetical protein LTR84_008137 [Exophiala bonariae]